MIITRTDAYNLGHSELVTFGRDETGSKRQILMCQLALDIRQSYKAAPSRAYRLDQAKEEPAEPRSGQKRAQPP